MCDTTTYQPTEGLFTRIDEGRARERKKGQIHLFREHRCSTDSMGFSQRGGRTPFEIVLDATEGFIPLWKKDTVLRWRFRQETLMQFEHPEAAELAIRQLMTEALVLWGDAAPVKFAERSDAWDFQVAVREVDDCDSSGCVLASAFFPDAGRHELVIFPQLFVQPREEQVETLAHEFGHVFGLRHFFAKVEEARWRSEIFGEHVPFSIMNYGPDSRMNETDRSDLKRLYELAWSGALTDVNGTKIRLVAPYHSLGCDTPLLEAC